MGFGPFALRGAVVMPRRPEDFLPRTLEQRVVHSDRERRACREQSGHDQIGQGQSERVTRPSGVAEHSVRAAVMPDLIQPCAGKHSAYRSAPGLRDQTNEQADECRECGCGKARPEHGQEVGQRARYGGAGKHRRITLTRVVQTPSMLSPSPSKITDLAVPGASPRPTAQQPVRRNCETRGVSSPWMRRCPQRGFSRARRMTSSRSSLSMRGRPGQLG